MQYNPKLKTAAEEIKAILNKHDIAAVVVLHTPGHSEYLFKIDPSYSCAKVEGNRLRVRAKAADYGGDAKKRDQMLADTANMLALLVTSGGPLIMNLGEASKILDAAVEAEHTSGGHTSHNQQNN